MPPILLLAALATGGGFGVRLEEIGEVPREESVRMVAELGRAIERACGRRIAIDDPDWPSCLGVESCLDQIRSRTETEDVVLVRIFGSPTMARVIAERFRPGTGAPARTEIDVDRDPDRWRLAFDRLAPEICPEPRVEPRVEIVPSPALAVAKDEGSSLLPWFAFGASAVALGAACAFGASSVAARDESQRLDLSDDAFDSLADRTQVHAIAADTLFVAAGAGLVAGVLLLLTE
ncbi:MAG: hypothetical protein IT384_18385 [Deltaproteobacteria bacterium]|nr:hypothetical protein [Deltaproteobacteria bacterium]